MQGPIDPKRDVPLIDLGTVRDTLAYIRDDLQRVPGLECAAKLIASALAEVVAAEGRRLAPIPRSVLETRLFIALPVQLPRPLVRIHFPLRPGKSLNWKAGCGM